MELQARPFASSFFVAFLFLLLLHRLQQLEACKVKVSKHIYVSSNGNGNFQSIQAAIDSIPDGNSEWVRIHVEKGVYRYISQYLSSQEAGFCFSMYCSTQNE
ncbi:pectinesterase 67 [Carex littledalei]|uniref:Pectinesterase 67 n=1 Tax=Carex littledalei TaxID=544730 RepID=A0A833RJW8_9POAL|nr:pectinesterase 67 [Carex littledalei]